MDFSIFCERVCACVCAPANPTMPSIHVSRCQFFNAIQTRRQRTLQVSGCGAASAIHLILFEWFSSQISRIHTHFSPHTMRTANKHPLCAEKEKKIMSGNYDGPMSDFMKNCWKCCVLFFSFSFFIPFFRKYEFSLVGMCSCLICDQQRYYLLGCVAFIRVHEICLANRTGLCTTAHQSGNESKSTRTVTSSHQSAAKLNYRRRSAFFRALPIARVTPDFECVSGCHGHRVRTMRAIALLDMWQERANNMTKLSFKMDN